jgi:hypothetical protein
MCFLQSLSTELIHGPTWEKMLVRECEGQKAKAASSARETGRWWINATSRVQLAARVGRKAELDVAFWWKVIF